MGNGGFADGQCIFASTAFKIPIRPVAQQFKTAMESIYEFRVMGIIILLGGQDFDLNLINKTIKKKRITFDPTNRAKS